jgi:mRNA-degrading endonuclease RelE of RelBE toxin-antitoxin system
MTMAEVFEEHDKNLPKLPKSYQRMVKAAREESMEDPGESIKPEGKWPGGHNGPVDPEKKQQSEA